MHEHMQNTVSISASKQQVGAANTKQYFSMVPHKSRFAALCRFIDSNPNFYGFIFCQTKILTAELADKLAAAGYPANALHGDMSQGLRNAVIKKFKSKDFNILVATDVAARGIDVSDLTHVINYSLPNDHEGYVHRIGRTGRAGKEGIAISFIGGKNELRHIKMLERKFKLTINPIDVPTAQDIHKVYQQKACDYLETLAQKNCTIAPEIEAVVRCFEPAELANIVMATVQEKFFPATRKDDFHFTNISNQSFDDGQISDDGLQELMIHLGTDDGISREDVAEFLAQEGGIESDSLEKLKVIKRRTFIKLPAEMAENLMQKLKGKNINGKKTRITLAPVSDDDWGSSGPRRGGRRGGDRDRGGRRGGDRGDRGGRSRRRY
jgi:ATP-dependent RNA helicase DeaD